MSIQPEHPSNSVDLYFMDARAKLIDIAAFMDRVERDQLTNDFRYQALCRAINLLHNNKRTENILRAFSDPTIEPIPTATSKSACGAWQK